MVGSRLYVGNLNKDAGERDLERFFRGYGRIRDVLIKNGYGFVELDDPRDADDAIYELSGKRLLGDRVTVERARGTPRGRDRDQWQTSRDRGSRDGYNGGGRKPHQSGSANQERYGPPTRTDYRITVENLSSRVSWQDLKDYMRSAGEVTYADAHKTKNEGVVEFASYSDMKNAIDKLDDSELNGRKIRLIEDKRRTRKSLSYSSRSRSRSRQRSSRSRSRSRRSSSRSKSRSRSAGSKAKRSRSRSASKRSERRSLSKHSRTPSPQKL